MIVIVTRNTFLSHVKEVVATPFIFLFAGVFLKFVSPVLWLLSPVLRRLPEHVSAWIVNSIGVLAWAIVAFLVVWIISKVGIDRQQVTIWGLVFVLLWAVATLLSVADHVRYRGWMVESNDHWKETLEDFTISLMKADAAETLKHTTSRYQSSSDVVRHRERIDEIVERIGTESTAQSFDQPGMFPLQVLPRLLPLLETESSQPADVVAFALLESSAPLSQYWLRMIVQVEGDAAGVAAFDLVPATT